MNRTTKVAVALIVAAGLSTMVHLPEQRAMAHPRLHLLGPNFSPDAFPFGPNNPDPPLSLSKSDPPAFGPNCVGCISTQNLANAAVTNPKLANGSVSSADIGAGQVMTPNIANQAITTPKIAPGAVSTHTQRAIAITDLTGHVCLPCEAETTCPTGTQLTGGGYSLVRGGTDLKIDYNAPSANGNGNGWRVLGYSPSGTPQPQNQLAAYAFCTSLTP